MAQSRMTKQRAVILRALRSVKTHPTADEIYEMVRAELPHISLGTVYRNLDFLANSGEILRLEQAGAQKHFDGTTVPHLHVRCKICGCIGDVEAPHPFANGPYVPVQGFSIERAEIMFVGRCDACAASA